MSRTDTAAIVLAAGLSTRMKSDLPKALHPLAGRPMVLTLLDAVAALQPSRTVVVVGPGMEAVEETLANHPSSPQFCIQTERLGTGHAVLAARDAMAGFEGDVLVLFADSPLITSATMKAMLAARDAGADLVVLGFRPTDTGAYGRLVLDGDGGLARIVEAADAGDTDLADGLCNSGVMAVDGTRLFGLLDRVGKDNAKGEYYLTDIVALARADGLACAVVEADAVETMGINTRAELAAAEAAMQHRLRARAMDGGATLRDPETVCLSWDTVLGRDATVGPNVVFGPGVTVGERAEIRAFCHLDGARVAADAVVGPFARLRPGAHIGDGAHVGNFVEIKNASLGAGAKANHLSYVGDASVGAGANIGAGTITCNYDGYHKHMTEIGAGAFIGSNTALVAPVKVGDGAVVGAGSVITRDVETDALAVARGEQKSVAGWARKRRDKKSAKR